MGRPFVFNAPTTLYHPVEGERTFPQGETDPGPAWTDRIGGAAVGAATTTQALKDLITAQEQIEDLEKRLMANGADLAKSAKTREEALAKVTGLEQVALEAIGKHEAAEAQSQTYMRERDQARVEVEALRAKLKPAKAD
jgi:hypothetical protein